MVDDGKVFLCVLMFFVIILSTKGFHMAIQQFCVIYWHKPMMRGLLMKCESNPSDGASALKLHDLETTCKNALLKGVVIVIITLSIIALAALIFYATMFLPSIRLV